MPLVIKQSACSSMRQDCVSVDICLWSSNNRPAHRCARTACRLTDALSDRTDCVSIDICLCSSNSRPAHRRARTACRSTYASGHQTVGLLIGAPGLRVGRHMPLVIKQAACSSTRQDCVSFDRRLWMANNRPAHLRARTARRLTDAPGDQTLGLLFGGPTQPHSPQSPLCLIKLTRDLTNRPEQSHILTYTFDQASEPWVRK